MISKTTPQAPGNTVGALQELCVKHGYPMPTYDLGTHTLLPLPRHNTNFCVSEKYFK